MSKNPGQFKVTHVDPAPSSSLIQRVNRLHPLLVLWERVFTGCTPVHDTFNIWYRVTLIIFIEKTLTVSSYCTLLYPAGPFYFLESLKTSSKLQGGMAFMILLLFGTLTSRYNLHILIYISIFHPDLPLDAFDLLIRSVKPCKYSSF